MCSSLEDVQVLFYLFLCSVLPQSQQHSRLSSSHPPWSKGLDGVHVPGSWNKVNQWAKSQQKYCSNDFWSKKKIHDWYNTIKLLYKPPLPSGESITERENEGFILIRFFLFQWKLCIMKSNDRYHTHALNNTPSSYKHMEHASNEPRRCQCLDSSSIPSFA